MRSHVSIAVGFAVVVLSVALTRAVGDDVFYDIALEDLDLTDGQLPDEDSVGRFRWQLASFMKPRVVLESDGEAYFYNRRPELAAPSDVPRLSRSVSIKAPEGRDVSGRLFMPKADSSGMVVLRFMVPASTATAEAREAFYHAKLFHYSDLQNGNFAGGAWFRRQCEDARRGLGKNVQTDDLLARRRLPSEAEDMYALFSGGRAVSENLQLDRQLPLRPGQSPSPADTPAGVDVASIRGITVRHYDWTKRVKDLKPMVDPLASAIPADQHALFLPSFAAALVLADEANRSGTPLLQLAEPQSEDAGTLERYQRQLGLPLGAAAKFLGPRLVDSLALTGSDPYFRTGTDVALLLESKDPVSLAAAILAQVTQAAAAVPDAQPQNVDILGIKVQGIRSASRIVSSYIAVVGPNVVIGNSPAQLKRIIGVSQGQVPAIASLPEYVFFRDRYPRTDAQETGLLFLSDATIRRWCGPRWRIASARRVLADAVLADLQGERLDDLVAGRVPTPLTASMPQRNLDLGQLRLSSIGATSSIYGSLAFGTPIIELSLDHVTPAEKESYERWRDAYQQNWQQFFDPIAIRFELSNRRLVADLTVIPLILATDYRQFASVVQGATIGPDSGDPHDALLHLVFAFNKKSDTVRSFGQFALQMAPGVKVDPFGWLGESIAVYVDDDPLWAELAKAESTSSFFEKNIGRLPVAIHAEVVDGFKLTAFLAALRAFLEQVAPGMTHWEPLTYKELPYVKVSPTEQARGMGLGEEFALYYFASGDALIMTLNENVLKRALDRRLDRQTKDKTAEQGNGPPHPADDWLGSSVAVRADRRALVFLGAAGGFLGSDYQSFMQAAAWRNLPILNIWKTRYPDRDPLKVHELFTRVRLVCPGGGEYVWNDEWRTMESTVYGHPGQPKLGPAMPVVLESVRTADFGLTFEDDGLRARVRIDYEPSGK